MKQNGLSKGSRSHKGLTQSNKTWRAISLMAVFVAAVFFVPASFAQKTVSEKLKEQAQNGQMDVERTVIAQKDQQPRAEIIPVMPQQNQFQPASADRDKGKQLKWQVVCSGGNCGSSNPQYLLWTQYGYHLCGSVGQVSTGPGSSESYGLNAGFWQEFLQEYVRGDVNRDGVIDIGDVIYLINYLFTGTSAPDPLWLGDCNCDDVVDIGDVIYLINYLFTGTSPPGC